MWNHQPGMRMWDIIPTIDHLLLSNNHPNILILHCSGNDIGQFKIHYINKYLKEVIDYLCTKMPKTLIVWSQILPRRKWRNEISHYKLEKGRKRINSCISTYLIKHGGGYLRYPEIDETNDGLYRDDTHLSVLGYDLMINCMQGGLYKFVTTDAVVFPSANEIGPWLALDEDIH